MRSSIIELVAFALIVCSYGPGGPPRPPQKGAGSPKEISAELARLVAEDQQDQKEWTMETDQEFIRRQMVRCERVKEIVNAGLLASMEDWGNAALLLQHGQTPEDYLLAHVVSLPPSRGEQPFSRFLAAATLDRFLHRIERPQIFTTQSASPSGDQFLPVEPYDDSMPESIRSVFGLAPLPHRVEPAPRAKGPTAKELPKLLKSAEQALTSAPSQENAPEWLVRTRSIVAAGELRTEKDYSLAARILLRSPDASDLLTSHVCAMVSCFQGNKEGLRLSAETLDRFLLACDRPQILGTAKGEDGQPLEPCASTLPEVIRKGYELAGPERKGKR